MTGKVRPKRRKGQAVSDKYVNLQRHNAKIISEQIDNYNEKQNGKGGVQNSQPCRSSRRALKSVQEHGEPQALPINAASSKPCRCFCVSYNLETLSRVGDELPMPATTFGALDSMEDRLLLVGHPRPCSGLEAKITAVWLCRDKGSPTRRIWPFRKGGPGGCVGSTLPLRQGMQGTIVPTLQFC
jgi:hypothetical protein